MVVVCCHVALKTGTRILSKLKIRGTLLFTVTQAFVHSPVIGPWGLEPPALASMTWLCAYRTWAWLWGQPACEDLEAAAQSWPQARRGKGSASGTATGQRAFLVRQTSPMAPSPAGSPEGGWVDVKEALPLSSAQSGHILAAPFLSRIQPLGGLLEAQDGVTGQTVAPLQGGLWCPSTYVRSSWWGQNHGRLKQQLDRNRMTLWVQSTQDIFRDKDSCLFFPFEHFWKKFEECTSSVNTKKKTELHTFNNNFM